jgi:hypothetical protein
MIFIRFETILKDFLRINPNKEKYETIRNKPTLE